jgi:hypothetical protein
MSNPSGFALSINGIADCHYTILYPILFTSSGIELVVQCGRERSAQHLDREEWGEYLMQDPIEAFFAGYPPEVQAISRTLRAMVRNNMPYEEETESLTNNFI